MGLLDFFNPDEMSGNFESFDKGEYTVDGFGEVVGSSASDSGPVFVPSGLDPSQLVLQIRLRLTQAEARRMGIEDRTQGPPTSLTAAEFIAMVYAFGGDFKSNETDFCLNPKNRSSVEAITVGVESANRGGEEVKVYVGKSGWGNFPDSAIPVGFFKVKFVGPMNVNYDQDRRWEFDVPPWGGDPVIKFEFEIVSNGDGKPSPFEGLRFQKIMPYPFSDEIEVNGVTKTPEELGMPILKSVNWRWFLEFFAPSVNDIDDWTPELLAKPHHIFFDRALNDKCEVKVPLVVGKGKKKGVTFYYNQLETAQRDDPFSDYGEEEISEEVDSGDVMLWIISYLGEDPFNEDGTFKDTAVGTELLGGELGPWNLAQLGDPKPITDLTNEEAARLLEQLKARYGSTEETEESGW